MDLDPVLLARVQFAFTISFHIIFPAFTIGLAGYIATLEILFACTGREHFKTVSRFWTRIFAVSFGMGVVSGIVLSYQLGTNWSRFSLVTGNIIAPLASYEVLTAFFLEATFLGVLLFGGERVPRWLHATSAVLVAIGTSLSAFWILSANSWMHTPVGFEMREGIAYPLDWWAIVFNPSFPYRFAHMLNAAFITTGFTVLAMGARYRLKNRYPEESRTMLRMSIGLLAVLTPLQLVIGDLHGLNTLEHQPIKIAAIEAHWDSSKPGNLVLFAWPDEENRRNRFEVAIPRGASLILRHDANALFPGLDKVPPSEWPPIALVFFSFRVMVAIGLLMIVIAVFGAYLLARGRLFDTRWYLAIAAQTWWLGFVAVLAGWITTESGRQPYTVYGVLRTADSTSPVMGTQVATSLVLFIAVYAIIFSLGALYINRLIAAGPSSAAASGEDQRPTRALERGTGRELPTREARP